MASSESDQLLEFLRSVKQVFWVEHRGLPEEQIQKLWSVRASECTAALGAAAPSLPSRSQSSCGDKLGAPMMERRRTEQPASQPQQRRSSLSIPQNPSRKRASSFNTDSPPITANGRETPHLTPTWPLSSSIDQSSEVWSPSPKMQRTASGRSFSRLHCVQEGVAEVVEYDPEDYIRKTSLSTDHLHSRSSSLSIPLQAQPRLPPSPVVPSPLSTSFTSFTSPLSPTSPSMSFNDGPAASCGMSRHSSLASSFVGGLGMMKLHSQMSDKSEVSFGAEPSSYDPKPQFLTPNNPTFTFAETSKPLISNKGFAGQPSPASGPAAIPPTVPERPCSPVQAEGGEMERTSSCESTTTASRVTRHRANERPIAPKQPASLPNSSSALPMKRILSNNGKLPITKAPTRDRRKEKLYCTLCNKHPMGFRGDHELSRHTLRVHTTVRKVWVCVDASPDKTMLSDCKACRTNKQYNAYYNAAAHLRRVHFNPKEKKGKKKSRQASSYYQRAGNTGSTGGEWPPMDDLKKFWMEEREERVSDESLLDKEVGEEGGDISDDPEALEPQEDDDLDFDAHAASAAYHHVSGSGSGSFLDNNEAVTPAAATAAAAALYPSSEGLGPRFYPQQDFWSSPTDFSNDPAFADGMLFTFDQTDEMLLSSSLANSEIIAAS